MARSTISPQHRQDEIECIRLAWRAMSQMTTLDEDTTTADEPIEPFIDDRHLENELASLHRLGEDLEPAVMQSLERTKLSAHAAALTGLERDFENDVQREALLDSFAGLVNALLKLKADDVALELIFSLPEESQRYTLFSGALERLFKQKSFKRARALIAGLPVSVRPELRLEYLIKLYKASKDIRDEETALRSMWADDKPHHDTTTVNDLIQIWSVRRAPEQLQRIRGIALGAVDPSGIRVTSMWRTIAQRTGDFADYRRMFESCRTISDPRKKLMQADFSLTTLTWAIANTMARRTSRQSICDMHPVDLEQARTLIRSLPTGWQAELKHRLDIFDCRQFNW